MVSEARKRANKKWKEKNKEKNFYYNSKSRAKSFILKQATADDLKLMEDYISQRRNELILKKDD